MMKRSCNFDCEMMVVIGNFYFVTLKIYFGRTLAWAMNNIELKCEKELKLKTN